MLLTLHNLSFDPPSQIAAFSVSNPVQMRLIFGPPIPLNLFLSAYPVARSPGNRSCSPLPRFQSISIHLNPPQPGFLF